ncbi:hypothetical protein KP509_1Z155900 [Ceratopteris richardii]|nr:hypothetical protein KP509_1Z155900 [Ceratopteris richardii]
MSKKTLLEKYEPQSTSVKNLVHLAQQGRSSTFSKFDYGFLGNLMRYRRIFPPRYHLENIPVGNLLLMNGLQDALADAMDVTRLIIALGGAAFVHTHPYFGHLDFVFSDSASTQIYPQIINFLES